MSQEDLDWLAEVADDYWLAKAILDDLVSLEPGEYSYRLAKWRYRLDLAMIDAYRADHTIESIYRTAGFETATAVYAALDKYDIPRRNGTRNSRW